MYGIEHCEKLDGFFNISPDSFEPLEIGGWKKTVVFMNFCIMWYFFRTKDDILQSQFLLYRKYAWSRTSGKCDGFSSFSPIGSKN